MQSINIFKIRVGLKEDINIFDENNIDFESIDGFEKKLQNFTEKHIFWVKDIRRLLDLVIPSFHVLGNQ